MNKDEVKEKLKELAQALLWNEPSPKQPKTCRLPDKTKTDPKEKQCD